MAIRSLILAYSFPPYNSIASQRPYSWYKYFKEFGVEPTVVTLNWPQSIQTQNEYFDNLPIGLEETHEQSDLGSVYRVNYRPNWRDRLIIKYGMNRFVWVRKILTLLFLFTDWLTNATDAEYNIFRKAEELMATQKFDIIIGTGPPFILHKYGSELTRKFHTPYIADYRDGWYSNQGANYQGAIFRFYNKWFTRNIEKRYMKWASLITTASPSYQRELHILHPNNRIEVVYNGFFEEALAEVKDVKQGKETLVIAYGGTLYDFQRVEIFLEGYKSFLKEHPAAQIQLIFYGLEFTPLQVARIKTYMDTLGNRIMTSERKPHQEVLGLLAQANIFLLIGQPGRESLAAKVFDYLALKRNILLVPDDEGVLSGLVKNHRAGYVLKTSDQVAACLQKQYSLFLENEKIECHTVNSDTYTRRNQAKEMCQLIKNELGKEI